MTRHYPDLGSASDWSCRMGNLIQPIRSTIQIWVVTLHQYGISALVSQMSFGRETSGSVAKCRLFSQAKGGSVCSQGGLLHSPSIFFPAKGREGQVTCFFAAFAGRRFSARRITTISCFYRAMFRLSSFFYGYCLFERKKMTTSLYILSSHCEWRPRTLAVYPYMFYLVSKTN